MNRKIRAEIDDMMKGITALIKRIEMLKLEYNETMQGATHYIDNAHGNLRDAVYELEMTKSDVSKHGHYEKCKSGTSCHCPCLTCIHDDGRDGDCCIRHHKRCDMGECPEYEKED